MFANNKLRMVVINVVFIGLGLLIGKEAVESWPLIKRFLSPSAFVYISSNSGLRAEVEQAQPVNWASLLPQKEHDLIASYQNTQPQNLEEMTSQILRSIQASSDIEYQNALISTNTVNSFDGQMVAISGFIVPIDFYQDKSVKSLFFVPYFGACLHFPAPPPNQMLFAELEQGFSEIDITQAYTLSGKLSNALFEDPLGTSAYIIDIATIDKFYEQPDNFRKHQ